MELVGRQQKFVTTHHFRRFRPYPLLCEQVELDFWLCRFIVKIRRKDGTDYPSNTLQNITPGLQRYMRENGKPEATL